MKTLILLLAATAIVTTPVVCRAEGSVSSAPPAFERSRSRAPKKRLRAFRTERELADFFRKLAEKRKQARRMAVKNQVSVDGFSVGATQEVVNVTSSAISQAESVTNVQHAGVDEGGIVKVHGDHLVVLRRGRLFTVAIGDGRLAPISAVDAFGPDMDPENTWYDEMLVSGDTVVVIGYSYKRGGTEIGLFQIDRAGNLRYRSTYHLRSNDYYSSRNYASRLVGRKLVFYSPMNLSPDGGDPLKQFPALRKWRKGADEDDFLRIAPATRVYRAEQVISAEEELTLHTVTTCELARGEMECEATTLIGPPGHVFYVSPESVYVWASAWSQDGDKERARSRLFRLPLDGSGPSVLRVSGSPVDQFSFLEGEDGHLNVLVRSEAEGDGMWKAEVAEGDVALLRVPLWSFSNGHDAAPASSYRQLPKPAGYTFQNRFVGQYLLYGTGSGWGVAEKGSRSSLYAARLLGGETAELPLTHGVDRIEVMGSDAVVVGTGGKDLYFTGVRLSGWPQLAHSYTRKGASQGELRSHGFFYKPDGPESGLLGLPIRGPGRPGYEHLFSQSASILFLRNESLDLKELGELASQPEGAADDECRASCVDWYGNARPLFLRGRVFALLGYEVVEGTLAEGRIRETRRISYAPRQKKVSDR